MPRDNCCALAMGDEGLPAFTLTVPHWGEGNDFPHQPKWSKIAERGDEEIEAIRGKAHCA